MRPPAAPAGHEQPEEGPEEHQPDLEAQRRASELEREQFENEKFEFDQLREGLQADLDSQRNLLNREMEVLRTRSRDLERREQASTLNRLEEKLQPHERLLLHL